MQERACGDHAIVAELGALDQPALRADPNAIADPYRARCIQRLPALVEDLVEIVVEHGNVPCEQVAGAKFDALRAVEGDLRGRYEVRAEGQLAGTQDLGRRADAAASLEAHFAGRSEERRVGKGDR